MQHLPEQPCGRHTAAQRIRQIAVHVFRVAGEPVKIRTVGGKAPVIGGKGQPACQCAGQDVRPLSPGLPVYENFSGSDPSQYPEGIYYICSFSGTFSDLRQLDETTYVMTLDTLTAQETEGEEWVEGGTLYIGSAPYGLEGGTEFFLYTPESSTDVLTTEALQVEWPEWNLPETVPDGQLGCWLLYNQAMDQAFFSYD